MLKQPDYDISAKSLNGTTNYIQEWANNNRKIWREAGLIVRCILDPCLIPLVKEELNTLETDTDD